MITIEFLGPINKENINLDISNLKELKDILNKDENLSQWLEISSVAVNGKIVSNINTPLKNGDIVSILPPVCGG